MTVTDNALATLRAQLEGNRSEYERLFAQLGDEVNTSYAALVSAAFVVAAERRFRAHGTTADVIRFVADVRARTPDAAERIDPKVGEQLFLSALVDAPLDDVSAGTIVSTQLLLLAAMMADEEFTPDQLDAFLTEARQLADEWMSTPRQG